MKLEQSFVPQRPIYRLGVCDSGVGGLSILHALIPLGIPEYVYVADTANVPYGDRSPEEIQQLSIKLIEFLLTFQVDAVVIACYTMCSVALNVLRMRFPKTTFIEIIDGTISQAAACTKNNRIGVIATKATVNSGLFASKFRLSHPDGEIFERACPQLVPLIEQHPMDHACLEHVLKMSLTPLIVRAVDTLVLGCTHFILIQSLIKKIMGSQVAVVHAQQPVRRMVEGLLPQGYHTVAPPRIQMYVTGNKETFFDPYQLVTNPHIHQVSL